MKKKECKSVWNWYIFLIIMLVLSGSFVDKCIESAQANPWPAIGVSITFLLIVFGIIRWGRKKYLIHHPFMLNFCDKDPYRTDGVNRTKKKSFKGKHGLFVGQTFYLEICLKRELVFEEINIRLVKKNLFSPKWLTWKFLKPKLWDWENARNEKMLYIKEIKSLDAENSLGGTLFQTKEDSRGGKDGFYKPPYSGPQGGYLYFKVEIYIDPDIKKWEGYISFKHHRGGSYPPCVRGKLTIKNISLEEK